MSSPIQYDFRSDTVTRPSPGMRDAMMSAPVGDDVFGDDPSVLALEGAVAKRLGKRAALFLPSGTQSNLAAVLSHCARGDEYVCGQEAHAYKYEAGGAAVLGSVQPQPLANDPDGSVPLALIEQAIKPDDPHFAITRMITVENTIGGKVLPCTYLSALAELSSRHGLALHLDGARLFNAAVATGVDAAMIAAPFDSVSVCLSKGLGAPVGSVLVGEEALIARARRWRKMLGGGMRQAGVVAAAGLYALENNVARLAVDHECAGVLASKLSDIEGLDVETPQTNMVFVTLSGARALALPAALAAAGVAVGGSDGGRRMRWVTHLDVDVAAVKYAADAARRFMNGETLRAA